MYKLKLSHLLFVPFFFQEEKRTFVPIYSKLKLFHVTFHPHLDFYVSVCFFLNLQKKKKGFMHLKSEFFKCIHFFVAVIVAYSIDYGETRAPQ